MAQRCATCNREIDPPSSGFRCRTCGRVVCRQCTVTVRSGPSRGTYCRNHAVTIADPLSLGSPKPDESR
jgi:hypothetical protein